MRCLAFIVLLSMVLEHETAIAQGDAVAGKIKLTTCTGCHGIPGYKNVYPTFNVPKLAGQNAPYLRSALSAYKSGSRVHGTMQLQAESLSEQDVEDIVARISTFQLSTADSTAGPFESGPEKLPLCQTCHGADGIGIEETYPVLAGQYKSYLEHALNSYRDGSRKNPIMSGFAASLSDREIEELASWYSSLDGLNVLSSH